MALTKCRECHTEVSTSARTCPRCGITFPGSSLHGLNGCAILVVALLVAPMLAYCLSWASCSEAPYRPSRRQVTAEQNEARQQEAERRRAQTEGRGKLDAWIAAQSHVEAQLQTPRTAKFPWGGHGHVTYLGDNRWHVDSYVDAQNAFGAMIRKHFELTLTRRSQSSWDIECFRFK